MPDRPAAARPDKGMPPMPMPDDDVKAIADVHAQPARRSRRRQGIAAAERRAAARTSLVGDATAGQAYLRREVQRRAIRRPAISRASPRACPTPRRCRTSGSRAASPRGRGGRGRQRPRLERARAVTVTVTLPSGEKVEGRLRRIDDFLVTLVQADGTDAQLPPRRRRAEGRGPRSAAGPPRRCSRSTPTRTCTTSPPIW